MFSKESETSSGEQSMQARFLVFGPRFRPDAHGDYDVVLGDGHTLKMSRSFRGRLLGR